MMNIGVCFVMGTYYIIAPDNWIMAVDANNTNLLLLNAYYNIQWKECPCLKGIRL